MSDRNVCSCGSGLRARWVNDARGIPAYKGCSACDHKKRQKFRADVFMDASYPTSEPIEED